MVNAINLPELNSTEGEVVQQPAIPPAKDQFLKEDGHIKTVHEVEREQIKRALELYGWDMSKTAQRLGINRSTLYRKLEVHQIKRT